MNTDQQTTDTEQPVSPEVALRQILADSRVAPAGDGYVVTREDVGIAALYVRPLPRGGDWGSFRHGTDEPSYGRVIPGSLAQSLLQALGWALR